MQTFTLIDKQELELLHHSIAELKKIVVGMQKQTTAVNREWITLKEWVELYPVSESSWYKTYRNKIKHRKIDGDKLMIYKPSMDKFLMEKSIN